MRGDLREKEEMRGSKESFVFTVGQARFKEDNSVAERRSLAHPLSPLLPSFPVVEAKKKNLHVDTSDKNMLP